MKRLLVLLFALVFPALAVPGAAQAQMCAGCNSYYNGVFHNVPLTAADMNQFKTDVGGGGGGGGEWSAGVVSGLGSGFTISGGGALQGAFLPLGGGTLTGALTAPGLADTGNATITGTATVTGLLTANGGQQSLWLNTPEAAGAVCNGFTDDTAALNAYFASGLLGSAPLYITPGRFCVVTSGNLTLSTGGGIVGVQSTLSAMSGAAPTSGILLGAGRTVVAANGSYLRNLSIERQGVNFAPANSAAEIAQVAAWGASNDIGVTIPAPVAGVRLEHLTIFGFNTAVVANSGDFIMSDIYGDDYNGVAVCGAGDNDALNDVRFEPATAFGLTSAAGAWARPGTGFYFCGGDTGVITHNLFTFMWANGAVIDGAGLVQLNSDGFEWQTTLGNGITGATGVRYIGQNAQDSIDGGYLNGFDIGVSVEGTGEALITNLSVIANTLNFNLGGQQATPTTVTISGTPTVGNQACVTVTGAGLPGAPICYTAVAGDTATSMAKALRRLLNTGTQALIAANVNTTNSGAVLTVDWPTAFSATVTASATGAVSVSTGSGTAVAGSYGLITSADTSSSSAPSFTFGPNVNGWTIASPYLGNSGVPPGNWLTIDPTSAAKVQIVGVQGFETQLAGAPLTQAWTNDGGTGTILHGLVSMQLVGGTGQAVRTGTSATAGVIGVAQRNAGMVGVVEVAVAGFVSCNFDGSTTGGDYVTISPTIASDCHDAGPPPTAPTSQIIGYVRSTNSGAGLYPMLLQVGNSSAGGGGGGSGTVTSVGISGPSIFSFSGTPITGAGTLAIALANETANTIFAGPTTGAAAAPGFRSLVTADFPASGVTAATYGDATHVMQATVDLTGRVTSASSIAIAAGGSGTVTSVGLTMPGIFSVGGTPVSGAGTLAVTLATEGANTIFAGPTTGAAAAPGFRSLVTADFPASGVTAGTYGDSTHVAQPTVDLTGRITGMSVVAIGGASGITTPGTTVVGDFSAWSNTTGSALSDLAPTAARVSIGLDGATHHGSAAVTLLATEHFVGTCNNSDSGCTTGTWGAAPWVLPLASTVNDGDPIEVWDSAGVVSAVNTLSLQPGAGNTIQGSSSPVTINAPRGRLYFRLNKGTTDWSVATSTPTGAVGNIILAQGVGNANATVPMTGDATISNLGVMHVPLAVGTITVTSGNSNGVLINNAGVLGNPATGNNGVLATNGSGIPAITSSPNVSGSYSISGVKVPTVTMQPVSWIAGQNPQNAPIVTGLPYGITIASIVARIETPLGAAGTIAVFSAPSGTACPSGTNLASNTINANGTAFTNQTLALTTTTVAAGSSLCLVTTGAGNWTSGAGIGGITVYFNPT